MKERSREMGSSLPTAEEIFRDYTAPRTDAVHSLTNAQTITIHHCREGRERELIEGVGEYGLAQREERRMRERERERLHKEDKERDRERDGRKRRMMKIEEEPMSAEKKIWAIRTQCKASCKHGKKPRHSSMQVPRRHIQLTRLP